MYAKIKLNVMQLYKNNNNFIVFNFLCAASNFICLYYIKS